MNSDNESVEEENVFYFESDHLALRGNRDYTNVLRTIAILEAQKLRVHKQLEELALAKKRYMDDPELFLRKVRNGEELIAPNYMTIAQIPEVGNYEHLLPEDVKIKEEPGTKAGGDGGGGGSADVQTVRGRVVDESKPESYNRLWTIEEQRRLEKLLIEYPEERVEMHRFAKIAKALGNRTPQQVSSRVQKYFQKLYLAGMPIPGRIPKNRRIGHSKSRHLYKPSTFFPSHNVPVHMPEDDVLFGDMHTPSAEASSAGGSNHASADGGGGGRVGGGGAGGGIADSLTPDEKQQMIRILKIIREEKQTTPEGYNPDPLAARCEVCQSAAVSRTRWRCVTCYCYLNVCSDCLVTQLVEHKFEHLTHEVIAESET